MKFKDYIEKKGISQAEMARRLDTNGHVVKRLIDGKPPRPDTLIRVIIETEDQVSANEMLGLPRKIPKGYRPKK